MAGQEARIIISAIDHVSGPIRRMSLAIGSMSMESRRSLQMAAGAAKRLGQVVAAAAGAIALGSLRQTAKMDSAMGELASVGVKNLAAVRAAAKKYSNQWVGTTAPDFIKAAYDIKSGISSLSDEGVADFTRLAGLTSLATKASVGQMTSLFATGHGIYKELHEELDDSAFGELFSAGIAASVKSFKTTGEGMQQAIESLGAEATKAKRPLAEQLVILGRLQQTMSGSEAGTKYRAFVQGAVQASRALGLPLVDANRQLKSMPKILDLLRRKFGDSLDAMESGQIKAAFGSNEAVALIQLLHGQSEAIAGNIASMEQDMRRGARVAAEMAEPMNRGLGEGWERLTNRLANLADTIGHALSPVVMPLLDSLGEAALLAQEWADKNPGLASTMTLVAAAMGILVTVVGAAAAAMTVFNLAVLANPITWIVAGIMVAVTALVAAGIWLWNHWDAVLNQLQAGWRDLQGAWAAVGAALAAMWADFTASLDPTAWLAKGSALADSLLAGLQERWEGVKAWLRQAYESLTGWLPDWFQEELGISVQAPAPGSAPAAPGRLGEGMAGGPPAPLPARPLGVHRESMQGEIVVRFQNAPPQTRLERVRQRGAPGIDLAAGISTSLLPGT